ncbi:unnamed protein product [Rhodiola kirilowii]
MFRFWGSQEQEAQVRPQQASSQSSWYGPSAAGSPNSSRPSTPSSTASGGFSVQNQQPPSHGSPAEAAEIIDLLRGKSVDELRKLLSDKDAYNRFLYSLDQVNVQNSLRDELRKETLQLTKANLEKEPQMLELRNQCMIIRTSELAAAQEKMNELERQKEDTLKIYSPASLVQKLQEAMNSVEDESESLHKELLDGEIEIGVFVQKYKKLRTTYHKRSLTYLAAKTSSGII